MRIRLMLLAATVVAANSVGVPAALAGNHHAAIFEVTGEGNGPSWGPSTSADGRYVAFVSSATNLLGGDPSNDTNGADDVFVVDRTEGTIVLASRDPVSGLQANGASGHPSLSDDGRYVAFETVATNLVPGDANGVLSDIVRVDLVDGTLALVSRRGVSGVQGDDGSFAPSISADGGLVSFISYATNLVGTDTNRKVDAFIRNVASGTTTRVSTDSNNKQANNATYAAVLAGGGGFVAFSSIATNLVSGDTNGDRDVFFKNLATGKTVRASVRSDGRQGNASSEIEDISANGRLIVLNSFASNLIKNDANNQGDVFVRDRVDQTTTRISKRGSVEADDDSFNASISADGAHIVFATRATNLQSGSDDNGATTDVFEFDAATKALTRLTKDGEGGATDAGSYDAQITSDGSAVVFASLATDLVAGDGNGNDDVFVSTWVDLAHTTWEIERLSLPSPLA